jgi:hypothetical protein
MFMHSLHCLAQTLIGQPQQGPTVEEVFIQGGPYEEHQNVFE